MGGTSNRDADPRRPRAGLAMLDRVQALARASAASGGSGAEAGRPFQELLAPFRAVLVAEVQHRCRRFAANVGPEAWLDVGRSLDEPLGLLWLPTLEIQFGVYRSLAFPRPDPGGSALYQGFIHACLADGFQALFAQYPGLRSASATLLATRAAATAEYLARYEADRPLLAAWCGRDPGPLLGLRTGLSDPHRGGRSVIRLAPARGPALYYHPKDLGLFAGFNQLLAWINARGNPRPLRPTRCLQRPGYGWMEEVRPEPCADAAAVDRFYHRAGQLLCLVYALNGTDLHCDNLIACGEHPVLIDLETLLQPEPRPAPAGAPEDPSMALAHRRCFTDSVLRTLMLPTWMARADGGGSDISALGRSGGPPRTTGAWAWDDVGSDRMRRVWRTGPAAPTANAVHLGPQEIAAGDHLPALLEGFAWMHDFIRDHRAAMAAADGPLGAMAGCRGRFVFRATGTYAHLLRDLALPERLQAPPTVAQWARHLAGPAQPHGAKTPFGPLFRSESRALLRGDIPYFGLRTDRPDLELEGAAPLPGYFPGSGLDSLARRLASLDQADLERQLAYIRGRFPADEAGVQAGTDPPDRETACPDPALLARQSLAVAERLRVSAISAEPASATWLGVRQILATGHQELGPLGASLYEGQAGVALFLAAMEQATGGAGFRSLALAALQPLRHRARHELRALPGLGLGGATGCGSLVYSLTRCAGWLDQPGLLDDAVRVAGCISPERIAQDRTLDVLGGCAGACLGLLALHAALPSGRWLEAAVACGDHLLARQLPGPQGSGAWSCAGDGLLDGGFAHGAAGIGYALLRLAVASGEARFRAGAEGAYAFERALFSPEPGTWADRWQAPGAVTRTVMCGWCHGAPGVGLALAGALRLGADARLRQDLERTVAAVLDRPADGPASLCCGRSGRAELLFTAGLRLERPDWIQAGRRLGSGLPARPQAEPFGCGEFQLPSFFRGGAGCAYQALRLAHGDRLPSVLLWE